MANQNNRHTLLHMGSANYITIIKQWITTGATLFLAFQLAQIQTQILQST
jgi:hypothetical protein